jgi:cytochrome c biogenesis protein CcdA/thiol-disulfide isomerase/thioredoxin
MLLIIISYLGGILTIFSPCVLPVIPFIFARSDKSFRQSGLPMLLGMALTFSAFAALAALGGNWIVGANQYGRIAALVILAVLGLTLLLPSLAERLTRPLVHLGSSIQKRQDTKSGYLSSVILGGSIGLLWAPCAGPILGLVLAGAALEGPTAKTFLLLFAFAAGAATSLAVALLAGKKIFSQLKKGLGAEEWIKKVLGVIVLLGVVAIAFGLDTRLLAKLSFVNTSGVEQSLLNHLGASNESQKKTDTLQDEGPMPSIEGAVSWINSKPLNQAELRGKVVLIDFWTYSCINCLRTLPYLKAWSDRYSKDGFVLIGVHTPEFAFEKDTSNVEKAVKDLGISYPVAIDSDSIIWRAYHNQYWPAHYLIDKDGRVRSHHFGEGGYTQTEEEIKILLKDLNPDFQVNSDQTANGVAEGVLAPASPMKDQSPETYLGYGREKGFSSVEEIRRDRSRLYSMPDHLGINEWSIEGQWTIQKEQIHLESHTGSISYDFFARDLHLVLGSDKGKAIRFRVTLDGKPPGKDHGSDTDENGVGQLSEHRLYQLIRQSSGAQKRLFKIEFLDPGVQGFAFTFG